MFVASLFLILLSTTFLAITVTKARIIAEIDTKFGRICTELDGGYKDKVDRIPQKVKVSEKFVDDWLTTVKLHSLHVSRSFRKLIDRNVMFSFCCGVVQNRNTYLVGSTQTLPTTNHSHSICMSIVGEIIVLLNFWFRPGLYRFFTTFFAYLTKQSASLSRLNNEEVWLFAALPCMVSVLKLFILM